jgi:hypothetical protein
MLSLFLPVKNSGIKFAENKNGIMVDLNQLFGVTFIFKLIDGGY